MHVLIPALHRPIRPTGVCRHAANLAQCLIETNQVSRVTLLVGKWQQDYFEKSFNFSSPKVQIVGIDIKNSSLARNQWYVLGLPKLSQQINPDIIHIAFPLPFVRRWFTAPVISTIHDLYPYECPANFGYPQVLFNQAFLRQSIQSSDGLVCVSKVTLSALENYFPHVKTHKKAEAIYNVVDFENVKSEVPNNRPGCNFSNPFLMTVAQHRRNKNIDLLIKAYSDLRDRHRLKPDTWLLIVGSSGPETDKLTELVETLGLKDQIIFLSGLKDEELRWLYEQADLFVIPSSTEGFCLPLVEARSLCCPTLCSDIPIFREVGGSQCQYFTLNQQSLSNLTEAILFALSQSFSTATTQDSRFSKKEISQKLLDFYQSVQAVPKIED